MLLADSVLRDNAKLVSCGGDKQIFYWDVASGKVIRKFRGHNSEVMHQPSIDWDIVMW